MKRHFLLFASMVIASFSFAQKTSIGIKAGVTSATMKGEAVSSVKNLIEYTKGAITTENRTGLFGGINVNIPISEQVSIEPGLYYAQKGYALKGALNMKGMEIINANARAQLNSHYIDLPVVVKGNFGGLQVFAGPQVSYLAKADLRTSAGILGFNVLNKTMDATEQLNKWDAGITGGLGYQFKNGFNLTASYDHGLSKTDANQNFDAYNRAFKVGAGFKF
jgi:hypothetical protein